MKQIICSHCGKDTSDFYIKLDLHSEVYRKRCDDIIDKINNSELTSIANLCKDCFDKFAEIFENF